MKKKQEKYTSFGIVHYVPKTIAKITAEWSVPSS